MGEAAPGIVSNGVNAQLCEDRDDTEKCAAHGRCRIDGRFGQTLDVYASVIQCHFQKSTALDIQSRLHWDSARDSRASWVAYVAIQHVLLIASGHRYATTTEHHHGRCQSHQLATRVVNQSPVLDDSFMGFRDGAANGLRSRLENVGVRSELAYAIGQVAYLPPRKIPHWVAEPIIS